MSVLRKTEGSIYFTVRGLIFKKRTLWVNVAKRTLVLQGPGTQEEVERIHQLARETPFLAARIGDRQYWLYTDKWHWDDENLSAEQVRALLITKQQRREAQIKRAETMVAMALAPTPTQRQQIADDVKQLVWQRDGGACTKCQSTVELQFDHIIPVSLGGAHTQENLQILCGPCNRRKGAGIA